MQNPFINSSALQITAQYTIITIGNLIKQKHVFKKKTWFVWIVHCSFTRNTLKEHLGRLISSKHYPNWFQFFKLIFLNCRQNHTTVMGKKLNNWLCRMLVILQVSLCITHVQHQICAIKPRQTYQTSNMLVSFFIISGKCIWQWPAHYKNEGIFVCLLIVHSFKTQSYSLYWFAKYTFRSLLVGANWQHI